MATVNVINTLNAVLTIASGTGDMTFAADAASKAVTIGASSAAGSSTTSIDVRPSGTINMGTTIAKSVLIGNSAAAGNTVNFRCAGTVNIGATIAKTITLGSIVTTSKSTFGNATSAMAVLFPSVDVTGTTYTMAVGTLHIADNGSLVTLTMPSTAIVGALVRLTGFGAGGWTIAQNSGQIINSTAASTTSGITGTLSSGGRYDSVELVCTVANTTWSIRTSIGTLTFV